MEPSQLGAASAPRSKLTMSSPCFKGAPKHEAGKPGEQRRSVLSAARAKGELGWTPEHDLSRGLGETVAWFANKK